MDAIAMSIGFLLTDCRKLLQAFGLVFLFLCHPVSLADGLDLTAEDFLESIGYRAEAILQSDAMNDDEKFEDIQKLLRNSVDLKLTSQRVLGPSWKTASEEQRREYSELFADYVLKIYPRALLDQGSQGFVVTGSKKSTGNDIIVFSRIRNTEGSSVQWSWKVRNENGEYKIIDLLADGISMTSTLREEFNSYIFHHGLDGLLHKLRSTE